MHSGVVLHQLLHHGAFLCCLESCLQQGVASMFAAGVLGTGVLYTSCVRPIADTEQLLGCVVQPAGAVFKRVTLFLH